MTYTETQFREWVHDIWAVDVDAPLQVLAKIAEQKGAWLVFKLLNK
jgi:hypothetical protein